MVAYDYDPVGNRNSVVDNNVSTPYTANNVNEYTAVGSEAPSYDANGNITHRGGWSYTYDAQNRLIEATDDADTMTIVLSYDGRNRCVNRDVVPHSFGGGGLVNTINFYYDGWNLIEEQI